VRLPRDLSGRDFAKRLEHLGYVVTRQTGSHLRLTTQQGGEQDVTTQAHDALRGSAATLSGQKGPTAGELEDSWGG
jgi:predicted RNA binding protein YcfA (HicA-like mRNA interferase family)